MPRGDSARREGRATNRSLLLILCPLAVVRPTRPSRVANTRYFSAPVAEAVGEVVADGVRGRWSVVVRGRLRIAGRGLGGSLVGVVDGCRSCGVVVGAVVVVASVRSEAVVGGGRWSGLASVRSSGWRVVAGGGRSSPAAGGRFVAGRMRRTRGRAGGCRARRRRGRPAGQHRRVRGQRDAAHRRAGRGRRRAQPAGPVSTSRPCTATAGRGSITLVPASPPVGIHSDQLPSASRPADVDGGRAAGRAPRRAPCCPPARSRCSAAGSAA